MTGRHRLFAAIAAALILLLVVLGTILFRGQVQRRRVFRPAAGEVKPEAPERVPPAEQWSTLFRQLEGEDLVELLENIERAHPDLYRRWSLGYLHARALSDAGEEEESLERLAPYLEKSHPFRGLALYHRASIAEGEEASRHRMELLDQHPQSVYREEIIDDEIDFLAGLDDPARLQAFGQKIERTASTERRREIGAGVVEALVRNGDDEEALARGLTLLRAGTGDDAADRVARALDQPAVIDSLDGAQLALFGEAFQTHRHYDRAVALLQQALKSGYSDDLQYAVGRSYFGAEKYIEAQAAYMRGANVTKKPEQRCTFLWHAARAAQLRGEDDEAERLMTAAVAVKGKFPATTAALTQRLRTRLRQGRFNEAASDLALLKRMAGNERAFLDGSLAFAVGALASGKARLAHSTLGAVPRKLLDGYDRAEFAYWSGRAEESFDRTAAVRSYLAVIRGDAASHFAVFARQRLNEAALRPLVAGELAVRDAQVKSLLAAEKYDLARRIQTDRVHLSTTDREEQLKRLAAIYRETPVYSDVLALEPLPLPRFPSVDPSDHASLLMAMGLFDEVKPEIEERFALRPAQQALTRSLALNLGASSRESIYAVEVMMKRVPDDYHPDLLPSLVRQLLHPRYFYPYIASDAKSYGADPALLLSIMREESRFNPRAKSQAAARGLLQFIITTARDIGRDVGLVDVEPEDLYDPRVIIRLGAKYVSELSEEFDGNRYRIAAAYNAGPKQTALWTRMQPAPGDDYFLTAVNFDETKHYVRKVLNAYEEYRGEAEE